MGWGKKEMPQLRLFSVEINGPQEIDPDKQLFTQLQGQERAVGANSCFKPENLSIFQPQEKKIPFPKSKADNPVPRQLLVAF